MRKLLLLLITALFTISLVACVEDPPIEIILSVTEDSYTIIEGESVSITVSSNETEGFSVSILDTSVISFEWTNDTTLRVNALAEGETSLSITSVTDDSITVTIDVTVRKLITLESTDDTLTLRENETHQLVVSSNDEYAYESTNTDLLVISETGLITAKEEGSASIIVTSTYDPETSITIPVTIEKLVLIDIAVTDFVLVVDDTAQLQTTANDDVIYQSYDPNIASVSENGLMTAVGFGSTTIKVTSVTDDTVYEEVTVQVYKVTTDLEITGNEVMTSGGTTQLTVEAIPVGAFDAVTWESSDTSILTVDDEGLVTGVATGTASIIAKSTLDDTIMDTFAIEVISVTAVNASATTGDTYLYDGVELVYGERLYSTVQEAIDNSPAETLILIAAGTYAENITINKELTLQGEPGTILSGNLTISADNVRLQDLEFSGSSSISNSGDISNLELSGLQATLTTTTSTGSFIHLDGISGLTIVHCTFDTPSSNTIYVNDFISGEIIIQENTIDTTETAIHITAEREYEITTEIKIMWNVINTADVAFSVDMTYGTMRKDIFAIARFNEVINYTTAVEAATGSEFDFTLNYWNQQTLDMNDFTNVDANYLQGFYSTAANMPSKDNYQTDIPIAFVITNPIEEILVGETHVIEYVILPLELQDAPVKFITGNPDIVRVNQDGLITPLTSGDVYVQIRSAIVSSIRSQMDFSVITTPGIEIATDHIMNDIIVGDSFTLSYELFPYTIQAETATFTSSDETIATIDSSGIVTTLSAGLVTFKATLDSDPTVYTEFTIEVHNTLPTSSLLNYLTTKQVIYSSIHEWTAYGFQFNYNDKRAESVSRYYFDDIKINTSKIVPVFYAIRPGEPMEPLPEGVTGFNDENIYWVVVHDTASVDPGSNALAHANYLYNNSVYENPLWVSWHYTIDDTNVYQHLPENERGFHAGDGSTQPGTSSTYLGGGNRNGIGIEMSVNIDGDMYRTWQRTAKLVVDILVRNNLPRSQQKYHNDFSGKDCPRTLRNAGLIPLFEEFVDIEYYVRTNHPNAEISFTSNNPDYLDNYGRIIQLPERALTVSYTITVTENGVTESRTFYTYIPGIVR
jgi:N-acetylmuramoyl-L-alanine amidase